MVGAKTKKSHTPTTVVLWKKPGNRPFLDSLIFAGENRRRKSAFVALI